MKTIKNKENKMKKILNNKVIKIGFIGLYAGAVVLVNSSQVFAANEPLSVINNLSTLMFSLIRAIGIILLAWGIVQVGLALKSHDPSQRANGFFSIAGGVIITFTKEVLDFITGAQ